MSTLLQNLQRELGDNYKLVKENSLVASPPFKMWMQIGLYVAKLLPLDDGDAQVMGLYLYRTTGLARMNDGVEKFLGHVYTDPNKAAAKMRELMLGHDLVKAGAA